MKRIALVLGLAGLMAACDNGVADPPRESLTLVATVSGASGEAIGAALLAVKGTVESATVDGGRVVSSAAGEQTYVAGVLTAPGAELVVRMTVTSAAATPSIEVHQVADGADRVYPDAAAFTVDVREED